MRYRLLFYIVILFGLFHSCIKEKRDGPYLDIDEAAVPAPVPTTWTIQGYANGAIYSLENYSGSLWIGGAFSNISSNFSNFVMTHNGTGFSPVSNPSLGGTFVNHLFFDAQTNRIYANGSFTASFINSVAFKNSPSSSWTGITIQMAPIVYEQTRWNGSFVICGSFITYNSATYNRIAINNGSAWIPMGNGFNNIVRAVVDYNGTLYAAGDFTLSGTTTVDHIARWNGASWIPLGSGVDGTVYDLAVHNNKLIVAGSFSTAGGSPAENIASWDGSNWAPMGNGLSGSIGEKCRVLHISNNILYCGGNFVASGLTPAYNIAFWDGSSWQMVGPGIQGWEITAMDTYSGYLYVGASDMVSTDYRLYRFQ